MKSHLFSSGLLRLSLGLLVLGVTSGVRADDAKAEKKPAAALGEVEIIKDVAYYNGPDAHPRKHRLDLFLPKNTDRFPVLFFVHGGAWRHGDKNFLGIYANLGKYWAARGVGVVVANYRLSPAVRHPEHIKDVARALAWTCHTIGKYHGDPATIFVCGHSAGGHLAALLATDEQYLKAAGVDPKVICGVIPMSGVYRIPDDSVFFNHAFDKSPAARKDASPICHAHAGLPPFLVIYADNDLPYCGKSTSEAFATALKDQHCPVETLEVKDRTHLSLIVKASHEGDPVARAFRAFIDRQTQKKSGE